MPASDPMTALMAQLRAAAERTWRPNPKRYEGIGFFGVANMGLIYQRMESYRMRLPETLWPRAISIGVRTPDWVMEGLPETDRNREFASATYGHAMGTMGRVEAELVRILEAAGYRAGSAARLKFGVRGIEKMVARYAGLGWIGKSSLLVTPGAGPRAWWYVVLTDAPLPPSAHGPMERQCGTCTRCVRACPVRAFRDVPFRESDPLRARYREDYCGAYRNSTDPMSGCGRCVKVCPFGSRSSLLPASDRVEPAEHYDPATLPHGYRVVPPRPEAPQGGEYPAVVAVPALPETPGLIGRLLAVAAKTKAHFFGVADIAPALAAAEARGVRLALRLPRAVVFGIAMDDAAVDGLPESGHAYQTAYAETAWARGLSAARHAIGAELRAAGAQARPADAAGFLGLLKMAAHGAGLGWIGRNGLLVTPEVGPRLVLDALLTDAPLEPTARGPVENRCGDCRRCVDVCPVKAIGQPPPSGRVVLPVPFDAARCRKHCAELYGGAHAGCGLCVAACPFGRRRWYLPDAPELASRRQRGGGCHMNWRLARFSARAAVLLASVAAAVPWYLAVDAEPPLDRIALLPWVSPHLALGGALGAKALLASLLIALPAGALAAWRGRWFCRWLCPVGLLANGCSSVGKRLLRRRPLTLSPPARVLLAATLGGAAAGFPWFLLLDPLSLLSGALAAWRPHLTLVGAIACAAFAIPPLAGLVWPGVWCQQVCPLGAMQDMLSSVGRRCRGAWSRIPTSRPEASWALSRRFLVTVGLAALAGGVVRLVLRWRGQRVVRPPGAVDEDTFVALCARCGACTRACPAGIIVPDLASAGAHGLLAPKLVFGPGHCDVNCNACTRVCPTGAIRRLDLPAKSRMLAGRAEVRADGCLAKDGQLCMVCRDCCPYEAVDADRPTPSRLPAINADLCRGCGLCAVMCPGDPGTILVSGNAHQRPAPPAWDRACCPRKASSAMWVA